MSWFAGTNVSDQAHAHFGDILGNIVHVYQYPRTESLNAAYVSDAYERVDGVQQHFKRRRLLELGNLNEDEATNTSVVQAFDFSEDDDIQALLSKTYQAALSENSVLHHKLAAMHKQMSEFTEHLQRLTSTVKNGEHSSIRQKRRRVSCGSSQNINGNGHTPEGKRPVNLASAARDSPYCPLTQSASCRAEFYDLNMPSHKVFVTHIVQEGTTFQTYYMAVQGRDRRWVLAKASITFDRAPVTTSLIRSRVPGNIGSSHRVPYWLEQLSQKMVESTPKNDVQASLALKSGNQNDSLIVDDAAKLTIVENVTARVASGDETLIKELRTKRVPQVEETALIILHRITLDRLIVMLDGKLCDFRMAPYTGRTADVQKFKHRLNCLARLQECPGIARLLAVVTDRAKYHVRGYCSHYTGGVNVPAALEIAKRIDRPLPWSIRLHWIRKVVSTVADIHDHQIVMESLRIVDIRLDQDLQISLNPIFKGEGLCGSATMTKKMTRTLGLNRRKDLFQLGSIIWLITEQVRKASLRYCEKASCTSKPRYTCQADHTHPQDLPICDEAPDYINHIISMCCSQDFQAIPISAREILNLLLRYSNDSKDDTHLDKEVSWHLQCARTSTLMYCDECGKLALPGIDCFYHCSTCFGDDFDLCRNCYEDKGVRCLDSSHFMVKKIMKDGVCHVLS